MDVREKLVEIPIEDALLVLREEHRQRTDSYTTYLARGGKGDPAEEVGLDALAMAISALEKTKWISVKDRLPDKDGCYIVTACDEGCSCDDGIWYGTVVIEAEYYEGEWLWNENGTEYDITDLVTHWQPMPQPPKGE